MKKFLTAALLGASSIIAVAPAQAVVTFYNFTLTFMDNGDGTGFVDIPSFAPAAGEFVINYSFITPTGFLTSEGGSAYTRITADVDFTPVTTGTPPVTYGPIYLNNVPGLAFNEAAGSSSGTSMWRWPDNRVVATGPNPQRLQVSGVSASGTGRLSGFVAFNAVPEPATWALMIMGFGLVGVSLRSRRRGVVAA